MTTAELINDLERAAAHGDAARVAELIKALTDVIERDGVALPPQTLARALAIVANSGVLTARGGVEVGPSYHQLIDRIAAAAAAKPADRHTVDTAAEALFAELIGAPAAMPEQAANRLVGALRSARSFDWLAKIADRLISTGSDYVVVRRMLAQALIDLGQLNTAVDGLTALSRRQLAARDRDQVEGLLGRAHKQIYVNHVRSASDAYAHGARYAEFLRRAIDHYASQLDFRHPENKTWLAINLIALLHLARADGVEIDSPADADAMAVRLARALDTGGPDIGPWDLATIGEAHLALGDHDLAASYFQRYVEHPKTDAFMLEGTIRQLEEVWRLEAGPTGPGRAMAALKNGLIQSKGPGSAFRLSANEVRAVAGGPETLETAVPGGRNISMQLMQALVFAAMSVAWIKDRSFRGRGTGFVFEGKQLSDRLKPDSYYLLTNTHVICPPALVGAKGHRHALPPQDALLRFELAGGGGAARYYDLDPEIKWHSESHLFDAILLELREKPEGVRAASLGLDERLTYGDRDDGDDGTKVIVIGHARGEAMTAGVTGSFENNRGNIVDMGGRFFKDLGKLQSAGEPEYVHYNTQTMSGNSGSPVLKVGGFGQFNVVALHHAGFDPLDGRPALGGANGFNYANEGITLRSIRWGLELYLKTQGRRRGA